MSDSPRPRTPDEISHTNAPSASNNGDDTVGIPADAGAPPGQTFGPPAKPGEVGTLGPYRVVKQLGRGGMGAVYAAIDTRLDRPIALKVMLPEFAANADAKARFLREARAAAKVTHDNVVTVYEADEKNGTPYIAMQYLQGYPLDEYLKQKGTPPLPHVLRILREAATGLAAAHKIGLVHRDIKPGNLWLEAPNGRVKVLDFGLAKPVDADAELTASGAVVGTPAYMSPEQGRGLKVDHRTDLFSLGAVAYRLCTGRMPFEGPTTMAILMAIATEEPPVVRALNPSVPESLSQLVRQMLAKNPNDRPASATEVAKRLRAIGDELAAPPLVSGSQAAVLPFAASMTVPPESSPFAHLDESSSKVAVIPEPEPAAAVAKAKPGGRSKWVAAGLAALLLVAAGIVIIIKNKDGTETRIEVPDTATVTVKDKDGKTLAQVPPASTFDDRKAAEFVLSLGGELWVNDEKKQTGKLPQGRFTITGTNLAGHAVVTDATAGVFKGCTSLRGLMLSGTGLTDAGLAYFQGCKELEYLELVDLKSVTDAGLAHFKEMKDLRLLNVRRTKLSAKALEEFSASHPMCEVQHDGGTIAAKLDPDRKAAEWVLSVGGEGIVVVNGQEGGFGRNHPLPKERFTLTKANVQGKQAVTDEGLAAVKDCKNLVELDLGHAKVTDAGLAHFRHLTGLTKLDLYHCSAVTDAGLAHFKGCQRLTSLRLSWTQVTDAGLALFDGCSTLVALDLSGTAVTDEGLARFKGSTGLSCLLLDDCKAVTDKGLAHFKDCKGWSDIRLAGTAVTDAGVRHFKDCGNLWWLSLGANVTDAGLANFKDCKRLVHLGLRGEKVTDAGLAYFKECKELTTISLRGTSATDAALVLFKECQKVRFFALDCPKITDAGLAHLKNWKQLDYLTLSETAITDAGLTHLRDCPNLTFLQMNRTKVTPKALEELAKALPGCRIQNEHAIIEPTKKP